VRVVPPMRETPDGLPSEGLHALWMALDA
jgi:hypothetical protein